MDIHAFTEAAGELWDEAVYATDLDEGRMWAARAWETRGDALTKEEAIERFMARIQELVGA